MGSWNELVVYFKTAEARTEELTTVEMAVLFCPWAWWGSKSGWKDAKSLDWLRFSDRRAKTGWSEWTSSFAA